METSDAIRAPTGAYMRVPLTESELESEVAERPSHREDWMAKYEELYRKKEGAASRSRVRAKLEALIWIIAASYLCYYGNGQENLWHILTSNSKVKREYMKYGYALLAMNVSIFLYLTVYLKRVKGDKREWEVAAPWCIPCATLTGLCAGVMFMRGLWPVFHIFTPLVQFTLFMGFLLSGHFVSWPETPKSAEDISDQQKEAMTRALD